MDRYREFLQGMSYPTIKRTGRFVIYDEDDQVRVAVKVAKTLGAEGSAAPLLADIEKLKNHGVLPGGDLTPLSDSPERYDPESAYFRLLQRAYKLYEDRLTRYDALDFTDLLLKAIVLFERHPEILDRVRRRYRYILVDEYQSGLKRGSCLMSAAGITGMRNGGSSMWP